MGKCVSVEGEYSSDWFREHARRSRDANQVRRLLSLSAIADGKNRRQAAKIGGMDRQTLRDWVHRFNKEGVAGLIDRKPPGGQFRLSADQEEEVIKLLSREPIPEKDGVVRWRLVDLCAYVQRTFEIRMSLSAMSNLLKRHEYRLLTARPRSHKQVPEAIEAFKKKPIQRRWQTSKPV